MCPLCQEVWSFDWRSLKNSALAISLGLVGLGEWPKRARSASLFGVTGPALLTDLAGLSGVGMSSRERLSPLAVTPFGSTFERLSSDFTFLLIWPISEDTWNPPLLCGVDSRSFIPSFSALFNLQCSTWRIEQLKMRKSPVSFGAKVLKLEVGNDEVETYCCDRDK